MTLRVTEQEGMEVTAVERGTIPDAEMLLDEARAVLSAMP